MIKKALVGLAAVVALLSFSERAESQEPAQADTAASVFEQVMQSINAYLIPPESLDGYWSEELDQIELTTPIAFFPDEEYGATVAAVYDKKKDRTVYVDKGGEFNPALGRTGSQMALLVYKGNVLPLMRRIDLLTQESFNADTSAVRIYPYDWVCPEKDPQVEYDGELGELVRELKRAHVETYIDREPSQGLTFEKTFLTERWMDRQDYEDQYCTADSSYAPLTSPSEQTIADISTAYEQGLQTVSKGLQNAQDIFVQKLEKAKKAALQEKARIEREESKQVKEAGQREE
ncbi:MAG: hypothetical protein V1743_01480 [Nanoarchaeota archaeon]